MAEDGGRLARAVAQHARTALLMGAEAVPCYRVDRAASEVEAKPEGAWRAEAVEAKIDAGGTTVGAVEVVGRRASAERLLEAIRARYEREAPHKAFVTGHTRIVFGEGDPCARLMFVGEAPGEEEDKTGRPFVGRAGQLLDKMIAAMGVKREDVYIANVLKTRPPNNATPTSEEAALCAPYLYDQIEAVSPEVIVTLGLPASRTLLGVQESMARLRGRWWAFRDPRRAGGREVAVMPTYHPAFLLRQYTTENRAKVWSDLRMVVERLSGAGAA